MDSNWKFCCFFFYPLSIFSSTPTPTPTSPHTHTPLRPSLCWGRLRPFVQSSAGLINHKHSPVRWHQWEQNGFIIAARRGERGRGALWEVQRKRQEHWFLCGCSEEPGQDTDGQTGGNTYICPKIPEKDLSATFMFGRMSSWLSRINISSVVSTED